MRPQSTMGTPAPPRWRRPPAIYLWRTVLTLVTGLLALAVATALPPLQHHPFALLYAYVVGAVWWGTLSDGLLAVGLSVGGSALLSARFGALPLEEALFALASAVLLLLVQRLRQERTAADAATRQLQSVQAVTETALAHLGTAELVRHLLDRITALLAVDNAALLLLDETGTHLVVSLAHGPEETVAEQVRVPLGQGLAGRIATSRAPLVVDDLRTVPVVNPWLSTAVRSLLGVPLIVEDRLIGVLHVDSLTPRHFTADEQRLLELVAARVALALDLARLYRAERAARATAEVAVQVREDVLAAVSHDLKNPLGAIKGQVQLLQRHAQRLETPAGAQLLMGLTQIERATTRMMRLINELLDAAQLQAGQALELDLHPTDLVALARQVVADQPAATGHQLVVDTPVPAVIGTWDAFRLERVLDNLLSNALKYSPADTTITVRVQPDDADSVTLTVQDQGRGIPAADLPHVVERYHRAQNVRGTRGTGLGLAGSRAIVAQHGGTLTLESQEGLGTTVRVWLPCAPALQHDASA